MIPSPDASLNSASASSGLPINLEQRSEEIQDIMGQIPHWIVRWGSATILLILSLLLVGTWVIHYPDVISARFTLSTQMPPISMVTRVSGPLKLLVRDYEFVKKGTSLAIVKSAVAEQDVETLAQRVMQVAGQLRQNEVEQLDIPPLTDLDLGDLQAPYQSLVQSLQEYRLQHTSSARRAQLTYLTQQLKQHERLGQQLAKQQALASQELALARKRYSADQLLLANKVIADADADHSQQDYLHAKGAYESAQNNIINNQLTITQLQAQQTGLQLTASDQNVQTRDQIQRSLRSLASQIQLWRERYILTAPVAGVVSFSRLRSNEQFVQVGEEALTLVPRSASYIGQLYLPLAGSGKVKVGQRVNLRFDAYPSTEFGLVAAQVQTIAAVPNDGAYLVQVRLTDGMRTSYHKQLPFRQQMQGQAEIITQDARLIERFFNQIRSLLDRQ